MSVGIKITNREQFNEIPTIDLVLAVRQPSSKNRIHFRSCVHMILLGEKWKVGKLNTDYYHCKQDEEKKIHEEYIKAKWCKICEKHRN